MTDMHSIPHNVSKTQAELANNHEEPLKNGYPNCATADSPETKDTKATDTQAAAQQLYALGLNVFPQPFGSKAGYPWRQLQYTRLHNSAHTYGLENLFSQPCNIAVMCGKTSRNLFVLDCESEDSFKRNVAAMRTRNIAIWAVGTARGGHLYMFCADGEVQNISSETLGDMEVKGGKGYVLTAPSLHPSGIPYQWLRQEGPEPPTVTLQDIDWLNDLQGNPINLKIEQNRTKRSTKTPDPQHWTPLSRSTQHYLKNGAQTAHGQRNNALFRAACDMAGNNYSEATTSQILEPIASSSGLPNYEIRRTIQSAYSRTRTPSRPTRTNEPKPHRELWKYAAGFAEQHQWEGRTKTTDQAVFYALTERARDAANENGVFRASIRELSEKAQIGTATVQKSLKRLQQHNPPLVFKVSQKDQTSGANLWRFSDYVLTNGKKIILNANLKTDTLPPAPPWLSFSVSFTKTSDLLERGALGRTGLTVYRAMLTYAAPALPAEIAELSGCTVNQVNYALGKMRRFGLVERAAAGWQALALEDEQLERQVAQRAGTQGSSARRRKRYARERALFIGRIIYVAMQQDWRRNSGEQARGENACSMEKSCAIVEPATIQAADTPLTVQPEHGSPEAHSPEARAGQRNQRSVDRTAQQQRHSQQDENAGGQVKLWRCPNCGQSHFSDDPPEMCDFCRDFTTWRELVVPTYNGEVIDDPLILLAIELGGVIGDVQITPPPENTEPPRQLPLL